MWASRSKWPTSPTPHTRTPTRSPLEPGCSFSRGSRGQGATVPLPHPLLHPLLACNRMAREHHMDNTLTHGGIWAWGMEGKPKHVRTHRESEQRSGERPIGTAKGKRPNLPRPCANPPPPVWPNTDTHLSEHGDPAAGGQESPLRLQRAIRP